MTIKTGKAKSYNSKKKVEQSNAVRNNCCDDNLEPTPATQHVTYIITNANTSHWYALMNVRYYKHLHENYHITWVDFTDKNRVTPLETQVRVAELAIPSKRKPDVIKESAVQIFNETIPPNKLILYNLTLYHTTNTLLIQDNQKLEWIKKEFHLL